MNQRTLLSATNATPKPGDWLLTASGALVQVAGPSPANSSQVPVVAAEGDTEPVLLPRRVLTWPPVEAPTAARAPAPAAAAAPTAAPSTRATTAAPAATTTAARAPAPKPATAGPATDRLEANLVRTQALLRARTLADRIVALHRNAAAEGRPIPASTAVAVALAERQAAALKKH